MARGMAPLTLIAFGALTLAGFAPVQTGFSLLLGACYSIFLFRMIGRSAARLCCFRRNRARAWPAAAMFSAMC